MLYRTVALSLVVLCLTSPVHAQQVLVEAGDHVDSGASLVRLDDALARLAVDAAAAATT